MFKENYPDIPEKSVVFLPAAVIVRTDVGHVARLREDFGLFEADGLTLSSRSVSGSISKLKRLGGGGSVAG